MITVFRVNVLSAQIHKKKVLGYKTQVRVTHCGEVSRTDWAKGSNPYWNEHFVLNNKESFALLELTEKGVFSDDVIAEGVLLLSKYAEASSVDIIIPLFSYNIKVADINIAIDNTKTSNRMSSQKFNKIPSLPQMPAFKTAYSAEPQLVHSVSEEQKEPPQIILESLQEKNGSVKESADVLTYGVQLNDLRFEKMIYTSQNGKQEVFFGKIVSLDRDVAIKVSHCEGNDEFNRVQREAIAICQLSHPNICRVYGTLLDLNNGKLKNLIVLENCQGKSMRKLIEDRAAYRHCFSENEVIRFLKQLISAFAHIQSKNIIHADIKPDNIVVSDTGTAKIIDFGMSLQSYLDIFETAKTLKVGGTILYFSPLQMQAYMLYIQGNNPQCTVKHNPLKSDVFSLGLSFIHLTTMNPPLGLNTFDQNIQARIASVISSIPYSPYIKQTIQQMLIIDENLRPDFITLNSHINP